LAFFLCLILTATAARAAEWPYRREFRRRITDGGAGHTAVFAFRGGGRVSAAGRQVFVTNDRGNIVPSRVLYSDPAGETWVAYNAAQTGGTAWVYYGPGTRALAPKTDWTPQLSLRLTTLPLPAGALDGYKAIQAAVARGRIYGMGFVPNIWHGLNPYGPDDDYASVYEGTLLVKTAGIYRLFTNSDEASFVLLDGREVIAWPGEHPANARRGERGIKIHLKAGPHPIRYYHAEKKGQQFMSLGWTPPGRKGWYPVPPSAFLHVRRAKAGPPERRDNRPLAGLDWQQADVLAHGKAAYTRVRFTDQSRNAPAGAKVEWDFGDGQRGDKGGDHVYLGPGPYEAEVRIASGVRVLDRYKTRVRIEDPVQNLTAGDTKSARAYLAVLTRYDLSRLSRAALRELWGLTDTQEDLTYVRPVAEEVVKRFGSGRATWHAADRLAQAVALTDARRAEALYARLSRTAPTARDAVRVRAERLEVILHKLKDYERAVSVARSGTRKEEVLLGDIKIGDVHRAQGKFEEAARVYRDAQDKASVRKDARQAGVRRTWYFEAVKSLLGRRRLRKAREMLIDWEIEFPTGKLQGDLILATARYFQALGDDQRALTELDTLTKINPLSPYLPEAELRMGLAHFRLGNRRQAKALLDKVVRAYPNSRAAREAATMRKRLFDGAR
jgi:TolA-binding protein